MSYSINADIYSYLNYRLFLKDVVEALQKDDDFSYRKFSKRAGFSSPNFIILLIQGKRNLAHEGAKKIAKVFGLDSKQTQFFLSLIEANQAKTSEDKIRLTEKLIKSSEFSKAHPLSKDQFAYYSNWYNIVIRELLVMNPEAKVSWLEKVITPKVSKEQVEESLETLQNLGFIKKESSRWISHSSNVMTGNNISNAGLVAYHQKMIELAKESLDRFRSHEREVSSVTIALSQEKFEKFQARVRELKAELLSETSESEPNERVYQFNFQLFPLSIRQEEPT